MKTALVLLAALLLCGCTDPKGTKEALEGQGYTKVTVGGYATFSCGDDDDFATTFEAINPVGKPVTGVVCTGFFKGATVRNVKLKPGVYPEKEKQ